MVKSRFLVVLIKFIVLKYKNVLIRFKKNMQHICKVATVYIYNYEKIPIDII